MATSKAIWGGDVHNPTAANSEPPLVFGAEMPQFELLLHAPDGDRRYRSRPDGSVTLERVAQRPAA